ncbi:MAG TPA: ABC transporter ATP-binding protein/permease [Candidatus Eisenbergiella merdipullorum]|uniref:ABC transporter ATP-binding protein/permease n=1 Tax=Candidatus Eisenbergiella merdipullorum TaxID=2838553 RepID=A0A9D2I681_9FIRM|nr:ABC transporter ATP-binding protein/permease [Candidatus Eisenbergiella merdipullorum]
MIKDLITKLFFILNKRQRWLSLVLLFLTLVGALFEVIGVSAVLPFIQAMIYPEQLRENELVKWLMSALRLESSGQLLAMIASGVILVYLLKNAYLTVLSYIRVKSAASIQRELGVRIMKIYMRQGYLFFTRNNTNDMYREITGDVQGIYNILNYLLRLAAEGITVFCICIYMFITDAVMAALTAVTALISVAVIIFISKNKMKKYGEQYRTNEMLTRKWAAQAFQGIKEVLVWNRQQFFVNRYEEATVKQQSALIRQTVAAESPAYILEFTCVTGLIAAVSFRVLLGGDNSSFILNVAAFAVSAFRIMPSLGRMTNAVNNILFNIPSMNKTYDTLRKHRDASGREKMQEKPVTEDAGISFQRELVLQDICWSYEEGQKDTIHDLNLTIRKGDAIAFIGESGAGKSTIADIILGLYKPQKGHIYMDGTDIQEIPQQWRQIIGYVPQSIYLLDDTIRNNIAFGIEPEGIDDGKIWKVLELAQLKGFVEKLPEGLDTMLGEMGIRFSGGQRQRIAIARALYYDPEILVLDEATSALDNKTEEAVMEAVDMLQGWKTLIIIAHRLSTIRKCDHVYEIKDGRLIEKGSERNL